MSRIDRVEALIRKEIADVLRKKINDTRLSFISITSVEVSTDLRNAKVYYSSIATEEQKNEIRKGLNAAKKYIKFEVGKALNLPVVPHLRFFYDDSLERGNELVDKIQSLDDI